MTRFAVVSAFPEDDWHSQRLIDACARRGEVDVFVPTDVALHDARVTARGEDADSWDVWLLARALGDRGDADFQCLVYRAMAEQGIPVVNQVDALIAAEDKVRTSLVLERAGVPTPRFVATQSVTDALRVLADLGDAVVKPPYGSLGLGIQRVTRGEKDKLEAALDAHGMLYLQERVGRRRRRARDLRLFVVGSRIAAAIERVAAPGELRTNVELGGEARAYEPSDDEAAVAFAAARELGLAYAGVDLMDDDGAPTVLEVNGTPRWEGILTATGKDMAEDIVAHAAALGARRRRAGLRAAR